MTTGTVTPRSTGTQAATSCAPSVRCALALRLGFCVTEGEAMAYHPLTNDTGGTPEQRRTEADRLLKMLEGLEDSMTDKERRFVEDMQAGWDVSPKQLFWLRDIKEKYL